MLRTVIGKESVSEIYKIADEVKRGAIVKKNLSAKVAEKANDEGVDVWLVNQDNQPMGALSDVEISGYDESLDTVKANSYAVLVKYAVGHSFATDQVDGTFTVGQYAIAKNGLLAPATNGQVSIFRYVGKYNDAGHELHQFEVVNPHTVA